MINKIDCGYCIKNESPYDKTWCNCYKVSIPFVMFDYSGVINVCKGWYDYCLKYSSYEDYEQTKELGGFIINAICEKYNKYQTWGNCLEKSDEYSFSVGYWSRDLGSRNHPSIRLLVTNGAVKIHMNVMPSFLIKHVFHEGYDMNTFSRFHTRNKLEDSFRRQLQVINNHNRDAIKSYINHHGQVKKYSEIIKELTKQIEKL